MGTSERRMELIKILCRRRHETVKNLSFEFGVSERTILRDVEVLSLTEPIYTQCGRYGGVFVDEGYTMDRMYMKEGEIMVLRKLLEFSKNKSACDLNDEEKDILRSIVSQYSKNRKGD